MQNIPFPFNQKEHVFDFKVKVNFESGNISLTAPQTVTPPARFGMQQNQYQVNQPVYPPNVYTHRASDTYTPNQVFSHPVINPPANSTPVMQNYQPYSNRNIFNRVQDIELVNSSYTSLRQGEQQSMMNNSMMNNSIETIECVICQKSFNIMQFDQHLQLHKNRAVRNNVSNQKGNVSNYAMTQNSVNGNNDSVLSVDKKSNNSFQNQSYQSQKNLNRSVHSDSSKNSSSFVSAKIDVSKQMKHQESKFSLKNKQMQTNIHSNPSAITSQPKNQPYPLLGRIQNPILAIRAAQQSSFNQSFSSNHNNSLNYSNSYGQQSTTRFNNAPITGHNSSVQNPQQLGNLQLNNSSFGNHPGSNVIGPSFFHNSSQESGVGGGQVFKGINRLAYNDASGEIGSHLSFNGETQQQMIQNPMLTPMMTPMMTQNQSYHSNNSIHSHHSINSHHFNQPIQSPPYINHSQQYSNQSNSSRNSYSNNYSQHSSTSLHANFIPTIPTLQNFQAIESRYMNQQVSNSRALYASNKEINSSQLAKEEQVPFSQNDISSISYSSRADMSQYSDWSDFHPQSQQKLYGYNSADNSIIKNMQQQKHQNTFQQQQRNMQHQKQQNTYQKQHQQQNNIYLSRDNQKEKQQNFFKKKKEHMVNSATSYYERRFKDEVESSSSDQEQDNLYKVGRMSYAQRLKEKRMSDNRREWEMSQGGRSNTKMKQSNRSHKSNMSKYSEGSDLSKTKLPVNYLAREEFISTSSTSKSTHKTDIPSS